MVASSKGPVTVDASVFVRAANPGEQGSETCSALLRGLGRDAVAVVLPTLLVVELAGVLGRRLLPQTDVEAILGRVTSMPGVTFLPLDAAMAGEAAEIALSAPMRGPDAVYVAAARRYGAMLITVDEQQRRRVPQGMEAVSPEEALSRLGRH